MGSTFLNFLRGMETMGRDNKVLSIVDFLNFLRGMETRPDRTRRLRVTGFLNFLRGMETLYRTSRNGIRYTS